tara:strand:- start:332 stop:505 length:174 start_codon:yes stop_codon:yes gene_type:complete
MTTASEPSRANHVGIPAHDSESSNSPIDLNQVLTKNPITFNVDPSINIPIKLVNPLD